MELEKVSSVTLFLFFQALVGGLISFMHAGWASRVYFSDNGSTAIEIALKMAFRKFCVDHETLLEFSEGRDEEKHIVVKVKLSCWCSMILRRFNVVSVSVSHT